MLPVILICAFMGKNAATQGKLNILQIPQLILKSDVTVSMGVSSAVNCMYKCRFKFVLELAWVFQHYVKCLTSALTIILELYLD
jgi:hypothetical protein